MRLSVSFTPTGYSPNEFSADLIRSVLTSLLGFFGGDALGISQAWIVAPVVAVFVLAAAAAVDWEKPGNPVHLLLLMLSAPMLMALAGFATPRSFLYAGRRHADSYVVRSRAAPTPCSMLHRGGRNHVGNFGWSCRQSQFRNAPIQADSVIPYQAIFDFIDRNANGSALVVSTDPVVPRILRFAGENRCAGYFLEVRRCLKAGHHYDSIFVISGHHDRSADQELTGEFNDFIANVTAGRTKLASSAIGYDADAALKSRLTGVPLDVNILTVDYYR